MNDVAPVFSIVMPNWNGAPFLKRGLGSLFLSGRRAGGAFEVVVVDDASGDSSVDLIRAEFPRVRLIINEQNQGFGATVNRGMREAKAPIVILANNDLIVREEFIPRLLEGMRDDDVFGVSAKTIDWKDGAPNHIAMHAVWRDGLLAQDYSAPTDRVETVYMQGGACAVRRDVFLEFGGFCPVFAPGYWEDYDLAYLARKRGMRVLYDPRAVANHLGQASMRRRFGADSLEIARRRNQILFTWLNLTDGRLWLRHIVEFPVALIRDAASVENAPLCKGFVHALRRLPETLGRRALRRRWLQVPDREILR